MFLQIVGGRIVFAECVTVGEGHHHDQRVRFGGLVGRDAHEHLPVDLLRAGWPHAVVTSTSGRARPIASTAANVCPGVYRRPPRALMKWVFSAFAGLWSLRAIEGRTSADLWPNDLFTKLTPRKVAKWAA